MELYTNTYTTTLQYICKKTEIIYSKFVLLNWFVVNHLFLMKKGVTSKQFLNSVLQCIFLYYMYLQYISRIDRKTN